MVFSGDVHECWQGGMSGINFESVSRTRQRYLFAVMALHQIEPSGIYFRRRRSYPCWSFDL